jgi:hypothetical protein
VTSISRLANIVVLLFLVLFAIADSWFRYKATANLVGVLGLGAVVTACMATWLLPKSHWFVLALAIACVVAGLAYDSSALRMSGLACAWMGIMSSRRNAQWASKDSTLTAEMPTAKLGAGKR